MNRCFKTAKIEVALTKIKSQSSKDFCLMKYFLSSAVAVVLYEN